MKMIVKFRKIVMIGKILKNNKSFYYLLFYSVFCLCEYSMAMRTYLQDKEFETLYGQLKGTRQAFVREIVETSAPYSKFYLRQAEKRRVIEEKGEMFLQGISDTEFGVLQQVLGKMYVSIQKPQMSEP